jgi:hypothetical protein
MRATVFGREVKYNNQGVLMGINLGFNFYAEHEAGTLEMVHNINSDNSVNIDKVQSENLGKVKSNLKYNKLVNKDIQEVSKWKNTPFAEYVLKPSAPMYYRPVTIDNTEIQKEYTNFLLDKGDYFLFMVSKQSNIDRLKERLGNKRKFSEKDMFYMLDYQPNTGTSSVSNFYFAAAWDSSGFELLIKRGIRGEQVIGLLESAIKGGNLAIIPEAEAMFNTGKGCFLVLLNTVCNS